MMKASAKISGLPDTVRGRFSIQQIRVPGRPSAEPNPDPAAQPEAGGKRFRGLLSRLRAVPRFFGELPSNQKRRVLVAGLVAGLLSTAIGLVGVTGSELAGGKTLSCMVWSSCSDDESGGSTGGSGLSILGGYSSPASTGVTPSGNPSGEQPSDPGAGQQAPQGPAGEPAQPGDYAPSQPGGAPVQPGEPPKGTDPAQPGADKAKPAQPDSSSGNTPGEGRVQGSSGDGQQTGNKEDRG